MTIGRPRRSKREAKWRPKGGQGTPGDVQREVKGRPREAKGRPRDARGRPKGGQRGAKGGQEEAQGRPRAGHTKKAQKNTKKTSLFAPILGAKILPKSNNN